MTIGLICHRYTAPIAQHCRSVDYIIQADQISNPASTLEKTGADTIIFFPSSDALWIKAAKKANIPARIGTQHKLSHWRYCTHRVRFQRNKSNLHESQLSFQLLAPLGIYTVPSLDEIAQLYQLNAPLYRDDNIFKKGIRYFILHPKSHGNGREWPIEHYIALVQLLAEHKNIGLLITGSQKEGAWLGEKFPQLFSTPNTINLCGKLTLEELMGLINRADGLIASGTGPLHISAALGKPTLGLFPPTAPIHPTRWGPIGAEAQVLCQQEPCSGCKNTEACLCMRAITPEQVMQGITSWL